MTPLPFTVIRTAHWQRRMGYLGQHGVEGQITVIEWRGIRAYVRENIRMDTFMMSSTERLGVVGGHIENGRCAPGTIPHHALHVLELAAPAEHWDSIADLVHHADAKSRPVERSSRWTVASAQHCLCSSE